MSAYETALQRYRKARTDSQAAPGDRDAADELAAAASVMERFAIDPEYDPARREQAAA